MTADDDKGITGALGRSKQTTGTLSEFLVRILDQMSLSAWLPSAALVLLLTFTMHFSAVLDDVGNRPDRPVDAVGRAFAVIGDTSVGGALLLVVAVVVLTMVTQAFSFDAIRLFEGYWGTNPVIEWFADRRCNRYRGIRQHLDDRVDELTALAWNDAERHFAEERKHLRARMAPVRLSEELVQILGAQVKGERPFREPTQDEAMLVDKVDWQSYSDPYILRRLANVEKRRGDYPDRKRVLPTRLGNVLRRFEDESIVGPVETFVQDVFDELPVSLQAEHDQQRTRLDLYCSMVVVVVAVAALIGVSVLWSRNWYQVGAAGVGVAAMSWAYRAAVASARAYGGLLLTIRKRQVASEVPDTVP